MNIRTWILVIINTLIFTVVITISFSFYSLFESTLDDKVLSQLSSIERLKRIQVEDYIQREWENFKKVPVSSASDSIFLSKLPSPIKNNGVYDFTEFSHDGKLLIGLVFVQDDSTYIKLLNDTFIQNVLLERTGMGSSGETYLVGSDFRLRSASRFFPEEAPYSIISETESVKNAFENKIEKGIYKDYRNIEVYSAYHLIEFPNFKFVILSEIDAKEVAIPLKSMQKKLIIIAISILIIALFLGNYLAQFISTPLNKMKKEILEMTDGNYEPVRYEKSSFKEIDEVLKALTELKVSLSSAISFSKDVGNMNLDSNYKPKSNNDILGHSLVKMQEKLIEYQNKINFANTQRKRNLIEGQETERKRLSQELHDGIGPLLTSLRFYVESLNIDAKQKNDAKEIIDQTIAEIRRMVYDLMPPTLIDFGVAATLQTFVNLIKKSTHIDIEFDNGIKENNSKIDDTISISVFRICQELINNTIKHSKATKIRISITEFDELLSVFYFDNGLGYNFEKVETGSGLINIKERVEILNGSIHFTPEKKHATVEFEIPLTYA